MNKLNITLPATSANLGPAFDAAALAFGLFLKIDARVAPQFSIKAKGRDSAICERLEDHLILNTYCDVLDAEGRPETPLALRIHNQIPIGKGCGSSAAARIAGIALAVHFGKLGWSDSRIVGEASRREHHPDNASACWWGGITVARMEGETEVEVARIKPKGKWPLLLAVPEESLSTEAARRVLPQQYSRADVVANIQNSLLLMAAFTQGNYARLSTALADRIHQPYRAPLCPLLPALKESKGRAGVLGVALSGAGPSVLIFVDPKTQMSRAKAEIGKQIAAANLKAELIATEIVGRGFVSSNWKR